MNPNIPRITKILARPKEGDRHGGLFVVERVYPPSNDPIRAWMTPEEFKIAKMKERFLDMGIPEKMLEKFEDLIREKQRDSDLEDEFG